MAKVQRRRGDLDSIREHGRAIEEAAKRLRLHTDTLPVVSETAQIMDRRIIMEEVQAIQARVQAIVATIILGGE